MMPFRAGSATAAASHPPTPRAEAGVSLTVPHPPQRGVFRDAVGSIAVFLPPGDRRTSLTIPLRAEGYDVICCTTEQEVAHARVVLPLKLLIADATFTPPHDVDAITRLQALAPLLWVGPKSTHLPAGVHVLPVPFTSEMLVERIITILNTSLAPTSLIAPPLVLDPQQIRLDVQRESARATGQQQPGYVAILRLHGPAALSLPHCCQQIFRPVDLLGANEAGNVVAVFPACALAEVVDELEMVKDLILKSSSGPAPIRLSVGLTPLTGPVARIYALAEAALAATLTQPAQRPLMYEVLTPTPDAAPSQQLSPGRFISALCAGLVVLSAVALVLMLRQRHVVVPPVLLGIGLGLPVLNLFHELIQLGRHSQQDPTER